MQCFGAKTEQKIQQATEVHLVGDFANLPFGIGQARRGWLEARDMLDMRPLGESMGFL